jgi:predicted ATPase
LRHHRLAAGVSQEVLAEQARMSANGISALECGHRQYPYRETVALLIKALSLPPAVAAEFEAAAARPQRPRARTDRGDGGALATNLPSQRTSLVGRETEIADIIDILQDGRLVTVTGAGGIGKTRIALAVGEALIEDTNAGVWLVELAPLAQGSLVAAAVARALNIEESPNRPLLETLLAHLKRKPLLLVLDNCEHVIAEAATLADVLLRGCPNLRILATSRESLRITGEQTYRLPSLPVPTPPELVELSAAGAAEYPAVVLFAQRAQAIDREFALTHDNAPIVAEICRRLDGIPLAIELAAARVNILPVRSLSQGLDQRFQILTGGDRTAMPRQQTLRALIDWSYDLLSAPEQRLFERLSIFAGGCTLATAAAVYADEVDELGVLTLLSSLVDKSLIVADVASQEARFRLLESSRQYAQEKLAARGEATLVARRHALAYYHLAERLQREYDVIPFSRWTTQANVELENWRAALAWTLGAGEDVVQGQCLVAALSRVWAHLSYAEGRHLVRAALNLVDEQTPPNVAAELELIEASIACDLSEITLALTAAERALRTFKLVGDALGIARAQKMVGRALVLLGRSLEGEPVLHEALQTARTLENHPLAGSILECIALSRSMNADVSGARSYFAEALTIYKMLGLDDAVATATLNLAEAEFVAGDVGSALRHGTDALAVSRALNDLPTVTNLLSNIAVYLIALGRYDDALESAREALHLASDLQLEVHVSRSLAT